MIEEKSGPRSSVCLQILVHGIFGDSMEWDYFSSKSNEMFELVRNENQLFILKSKTNSSFKSLAGLDKLGKRFYHKEINLMS